MVTVTVTGGGDESDAVWGIVASCKLASMATIVSASMNEGCIAYGLVSVLRVFLPLIP